MSLFYWFLIFLLSAIWATSFILIEIGLTELDPFSLVFWRLTSAALVFTSVTLLLGHRFPASISFWRTFIVIAFFANVVPFSLIAIGQQYIQAGLASILNGMTPIFTALLAHSFLKHEPLYLHRLLGLIASFIGVVVIFGIDALYDFDLGSIGQLCVIGAALSYGIGFILGKKYAGDFNAYVSCSAMLVCSAATMFVISTLWHTGLPQQPQSWGVWIAILFMAVVGTGIAYIIYYYLLARVVSTNVSLVTVLSPPMTIFIGGLFLGEVLAINDYIGMLLILGGLLLIDDRMRRWI